LLKRGMGASLKTRSSAKPVFPLVVLTVWLLSLLACTRSVVQPWQVTATIQVLSFTQTALAVKMSGGSSHAQVSPALSPTVVDSPTASVTSTPVPLDPTPDEVSLNTPEDPVVLYYSQAGDTLGALAVRFGVTTNQFITAQPVSSPYALLTPNELIVIPKILKETGPGEKLMPDSEVVFSPSAVNFDIDAFVQNAGGYLSTYREWLSTGWNTGADVIERIAIENSINPRLLLAMLEYQSHWVYGQPANLAQTDYPMGYHEFNHKGLYKQLSWSVQQLSIGYYGWRAGLLTELEFPKEQSGKTMRLAPELNAGSVAVQYLFSKLYNKSDWGKALYSPDDSLITTYEKMFDNPWLRAQAVEPLYPTTLTQPNLELPFKVGHTWSFSGGPHSAWGPDGALAALDFAPSSVEHGCVESLEWVTASAPGLVVRSGNGIVVIDLDGDGYEQTGWALLYLHVSSKDRVATGTLVEEGDPLGHPSCEGGMATGTHVHIARKYNGEWILADGPVPFVLSGWRAHAGSEPYKGTLTKGDQIVTACQCGSFETRITR